MTGSEARKLPAWGAACAVFVESTVLVLGASAPEFGPAARNAQAAGRAQSDVD